MADRSKIEWTDATWNPVRAIRKAARTDPMNGKVGWHCTHVSEGCRNCYAEAINKRLGTGLDYKPGHEKDLWIYLDEKMLTQPLRWKRPRKIFVGSMTDLFADFVTDEMLDQIFAVMALSQHHIFLVLTKRPERMKAYMLETWQGTPAQRLVFGKMEAIDIPASGPTGRMEEVEAACEPFLQQFDLANPDKDDLYTEDGHCKAMQWDWPLPNVWLGTSCEDQATADERIPHLLATPAAIRFISYEPALGAPILDRRHMHGDEEYWDFLRGERGATVQHRAIPPTKTEKLDWVICGGESGPHARPIHPDWARSLRDQCADAGVPFFFKQWGEWAPERAGERAAYMITAPHAHGGNTSFVGWPKMQRFGKARAGRLLDGVEHNGMPAHP